MNYKFSSDDFQLLCELSLINCANQPAYYQKRVCELIKSNVHLFEWFMLRNYLKIIKLFPEKYDDTHFIDLRECIEGELNTYGVS